MNILVLFLLVALSLLIIAFWNTVSLSWAHPIRMFGYEWVFFVLVPALLGFFEYRFNGGGLIWILFAVASYEVGGLLGNLVSSQIQIKKKSKNITMAPRFYSSGWIFLGCSTFLAGLSFLLTVLSQGFDVSAFFNINEFLSMNAEMAYRRYNSNEAGGAFIQILAVFDYVSPLCGGYAYCFANGKGKKNLCIITLAPIILLMLFSNAKAGFIAASILWVSGYLVSCYVNFGRVPAIKWKLIFRAIILLGSFLLLLYLVMLIRVGDFSEMMRERIAQKFFVYAFGQMVSFDAWFESLSGFLTLGVGSNTYMAIPSFLGIVETQQGVYETLVLGYGNVFTAFRGVIMDFGRIGGLVYMVACGAIVTVAFNQMLSNRARANVVSKCIVVSMYFWGGYSFIISPWIYSSYVIMMVVFGIFLVAAHYKIKWKKDVGV